MSDNKKYYYLKLKDTYFDQDHIKVIEAMDNGYMYSLILLKLYLKAIKGNGQLCLAEGIPYDPTDTSILAKVINHDPDHVSKALNLAKSFNMIEVIDQKEIWFSDMQAFIGQSSSEADRKRLYRDKIKELKETSGNMDEPNGTNVHQTSDNRPPESEIEKELKKEKKIKKEKEKKIKPDGFNNISFTQTELDKLKEKYNDSELNAIFEKLDSYKEANGRKYKSDMGAIRQWVHDAVFGQRIQNKQSSTDVKKEVFDKIINQSKGVF